MEVDIERRRKLAEKEISSRSGINFDRGRDVDPEREFRNIGEQFYAIFRMKTDGVRDPRLESLSEQRAQSMGVGAEGGFALPQQFSAEVREVLAQEAIVRPRATVIPAGEPPDAKLSFPALDQTSGSNIHGGVIITHTGEAITMTETSFGLREVSMEPKEMSAYIVVTNKLLVNWEAGGAFITKRLSSAMAAAEDYDFMRGDGINKALGLINSPCAISHTRAGVGAIAFADCYGMLAKVLMRSGSLVWVASQTTIPELSKMVDAGNHAVWLGSRAFLSSFQRDNQHSEVKGTFAC
jgi:HK97 family phage major capsid protein